jgi:hypothetical protein
MAKRSPWTADERYQIVKEALSQKQLLDRLSNGTKSQRDRSIGGVKNLSRGAKWDRKRVTFALYVHESYLSDDLQGSGSK